MGKGTIISGGDSGRYAVKLIYDRTRALKALDQINRWIAMREEQIYNLWYNDPQNKIPGLKLALESLKKWKAYYESIPEDPTIEAWCADLSDKLSGNVATIEINGDIDQVLIRPGYVDNATYMTYRDGQLQHIKAMTPEQAFYNMAMSPGWKKWMPTYRIGTIIGISGDTCSVNLDTAVTQIINAESKSINESATLSNVDIEYMDCNGDAFTEGDRVVVQFINHDLDEPKVIGFEKEPKECDRNLLLVWVSIFDEYSDFNEMGYNFYRDSIWMDKQYDALDGYGFPQLNTPMAFFFWDIEKDDYAGEEHKIYWIDPGDTNRIKHYLKPSDYPFLNPFSEEDTRKHAWYDILSQWKNRTNLLSTPIYTFSYEGEPYPEDNGWMNDGNTSPDGYYTKQRIVEASDFDEFGNRTIYSIETILTNRLHGKFIGHKASEQEKLNGIVDVEDFVVSGVSTRRTFENIVEGTGSITRTLSSAHSNSMGAASYEYVEGSEYKGDCIKTWGNDNYLSSSHAVQVHVYRGHQSNTFCQCAERDPSTGRWDVTERSNNLEAACKSLINLCLSNEQDLFSNIYVKFHSLKITALYFKGQTSTLGMLEELDDRRTNGTLIASNWCTQSAQALVDSWIENAELIHGDAEDFGERVGGENIAILSTDKTIAEVVNGWMESPHHRELIMNLDLKYAGYASGIYPSSVTTITLGPGQYDPTTGDYTTENTTMEIPLAYRGKMKAYCLRMTQYLDENE